MFFRCVFLEVYLGEVKFGVFECIFIGKERSIVVFGGVVFLCEGVVVVFVFVVDCVEGVDSIVYCFIEGVNGVLVFVFWDDVCV